MLITNLSIYSYYLKNSDYPVPAGGTLEVDDSDWEDDDELARTIESLDNFNVVSVSDRPVNYPRTREFPMELNLIGDMVGQSVAEVVLNDSQIKNLGTGINPIEIVEAPDAGSFIVVHSAFLVVDATAGAYAGIGSGSSISISYGNVSDATLAVAETPNQLVTALLNDDILHFVQFLPLFDFNGIGSLPRDTNEVEALPISINGYNDTGPGNPFSGGNVANSLRVKVWYTIESLNP